MTHPLTRNQEAFLCKIIDFIAETGKAPTVREAQALGNFSSSRTSGQYLEQLAAAGYIERTKGPRGLHVLIDPRDVRPARKRHGRKTETVAAPERARRPVGALLATASDLDDWATRRESQSSLPQMIRKLVFATTTRGGRVEFAAGEGVQMPGWDGITDFPTRTAFVPAGPAGWELGTGGDPAAKANADYKSRTENPLELACATSTFIFVTARRWREKRDWVAKKRAEKVWKEVVALDADDLESWLENAPVVHAWISAQIGKRPDGAIDIAGYATDWLEATNPPLSTEFLLAGREEAVTAVQEWLTDGTGSLALQAETKDEAIVFFASVLAQLPLNEREQLEVRTVIVSTKPAWEQLTLSRDPLILIPLVPPTSIASAERNGHRVVLPLTPNESSARKPTVLGPIDRKRAAPVLAALGLDEQESLTLAALARRSMMAFRRRKGTTPELLRPRWAAPENGRVLALAMLIGAWDEDERRSDRQIVSQIAGMPYDAFVSQLVRWSTETDPPVRHIGSKWLIVSKEDGWPLLACYLTRDDLYRFRDAAVAVLTMPDPRFELQPDEQWMAKVLGHARPHTHMLIESLADSLAMMGVRGEDTRPTAGESAQAIASGVTWRVLDMANTDHRIWASLSDELALLAEAAPDQFLDAVEAGLRGNEPVLKRLFTDTPGTTTFTASSPHPGLLWALERLAWSPKYLARASKALARLTALDDPRGTLGNRPDESLRQVFLCWHPQTEASLPKRLAVIDLLRSSVGDAAWHLLIALLPRDYDTSSNHDAAKWREWGHQPPRVTHGEYAHAVRAVIARLFEDVGERGDRWAALIPHFTHLSREDAVKAIERLRAVPAGTFDAREREQIRHTLRESISLHRSHPDATWQLTPEDLDAMVEIYDGLMPAEPLGRYGWLFAQRPALLEGRDVDWDEHAKLLRDKRMDAVGAIASAGGVSAVLDFARNAEQAFDVGATLGATTLADVEANRLLAQYLGASDAPLAHFARGFACESLYRRGRTWAEDLLRTEGRSWTPEQRGEFLICFPRNEDATFSLVDLEDEPTQRVYWARVWPWGIPEERMEYTVRRMMHADRPYTAAHYLAGYVHSRHKRMPLPMLIADTLDAVLRQTAPTDVDPLPQSFGYDLGKLVETLAADPGDVPLSRIAGIEWRLVPLLRNHDLQPRILHGELGRDPAFFVELVTLVYRGKTEERRQFTKEEQAKARAAYTLLQSSHTLPGAHADGSIDAAALSAWVKTARALLTKVDRREIGDLQVGQALGVSPMGGDGLWPHEAVRAVLEDADSAEIIRGMALAVYNSRGVVSKALDEGGVQERELVTRYESYAKAMEDRWPTSAVLLHEIARHYDHDAKQSDTEVELRHHLE